MLPLQVEEYHIGQLYSVSEASKNETGGGEGIEVLENRPFKDTEFPNDVPPGREGQYTHKIYHLANKVPRFVRLIAPKGALEVHEHSWNCYSWCKTVICNPDYMKEAFHVTIVSMHVENDRGELENVHDLSPEQLEDRVLVPIDIVNDQIDQRDYSEEVDPKLFHSEKTGRGPYKKDWKETTDPIMCAYKLVTCQFKWWGLQGRVEKMIMNAEKRVFTKFHREVCCWIDQWYGLTLEDIRKIEEETKQILVEQRHDPHRSIRGYSEA